MSKQDMPFEEKYRQVCATNNIRPADSVLHRTGGEMCLDLNELTNVSAEAVAKAFKETKEHECRSVRVVRGTVKRRNLAKQGRDVLPKMLESMLCVWKAVHLEKLFFEKVALSKISKILKNILSHTTRLRTLSFKDCTMGDLCFMEIAPSLKKILSITALDLSGNNITDKSAEHIKAIVVKHKENREMTAFHACLRTEGPPKIRKGFGLEHLDLSRNEFGHKICKDLACALHSDLWVSSLDLSCNKIEKSGMLVLNKLVHRSEALSHVNLSHNPCTQDVSSCENLLFYSCSPQGCVYSALVPAQLPVDVPAQLPVDATESFPSAVAVKEGSSSNTSCSSIQKTDLLCLIDKIRGMTDEEQQSFAAGIEAGPPELLMTDVLCLQLQAPYEDCEKEAGSRQKDDGHGQQGKSNAATSTSPTGQAALMYGGAQYPYFGYHHHHHHHHHHQQQIVKINQCKPPLVTDAKQRADQENIMKRAATRLEEREETILCKKETNGSKEAMMLAVLHEENMMQQTVAQAVAGKIDKMYELMVANGGGGGGGGGAQPRARGEIIKKAANHVNRQPSDGRTASPPPLRAGSGAPNDAPSETDTDPADMGAVREWLFTKYDYYS
eukprot:TRINITY_DN1766_c0_g2_i1.p1 TRINITY_DN1766_c0_g2~~TRINITY_DN1766_c0_g2_i1.p1  ORF type:complete len:651 (+),score=97.15 TRINITY_DN1766_c0_g2_i1:122-1954(+)